MPFSYSNPWAIAVLNPQAKTRAERAFHLVERALLRTLLAHILSLLLAAFLFGSDGVSANPVQTPENAEARLSQGLVFLRSRDFQRAREEFKAAIKANPALAQGHLYLGVVENQLGSPTAAISHLREALRLDSTSDAARYNLGLALLRIGNSDEAVLHFQEAVKRNPALTDARYNLGVLLSEKGRFREAIPHLEAARKGETGRFCRADSPGACLPRR